MIVVEPLPVRQARTRRRRARAFTAFLVVAAVLAPCVAVWGALHLAWPIVWAGAAGFVVAGWFGGGRLIGKVDDPT